MSPDPRLQTYRRSAAVLLTLFSTGVLLFWFDWFATGKYLHEGTPCYRHFENSFPLPDTVMALILFGAARCLWLQRGNALRLGSLGAGMALYLCAMDTCYHLQQGNFSDWSDPGAWERAGIGLATFIVGAGLPLVLCRLGDDFRFPGRLRLGASPALFAGLFQLPNAVYAIAAFQPEASCWKQFEAASLLGGILLVMLGASGIAVGVRRSRNAEIWAGLAGGAFIFWFLLNASFVMLSAL